MKGEWQSNLLDEGTVLDIRDILAKRKWFTESNVERQSTNEQSAVSTSVVTQPGDKPSHPGAHSLKRRRRNAIVDSKERELIAVTTASINQIIKRVTANDYLKLVILFKKYEVNTNTELDANDNLMIEVTSLKRRNYKELLAEMEIQFPDKESDVTKADEDTSAEEHLTGGHASLPPTSAPPSSDSSSTSSSTSSSSSSDSDSDCDS